MTGNEDRRQGKISRPWLIPAVVGAAVLGLMSLIILVKLGAGNDDENIVLSRNDVEVDTAGARIWRGSMMNRTDTLHSDVAVTVRFLGVDDRVVGETKASAAELRPGESFPIEASLPPEALRMQIFSLVWYKGDIERTLGPWAPWEFGYLQYDPTQ